MKAIAILFVLAAVAATWSWEKLSAARLAAEIDLRRNEQRELAAARRERLRLLALLPADDELARLREAARQHAALEKVAREEEAASVTGSPALPLGEWRPAPTWRNRGVVTPHATMETLLWSAAGGDVATLKGLLSVNGPTREKAASLLAGLPESMRALYPRPEDLIAAFTIKNIPIGAAQLVWFNQSTDDDATVCVFLQNPAAPAGNPEATVATATESREQALQRAQSRERNPPQARDLGKAGETYLTLHQEGAGWRIVVPPAAVDQIAREIAGPPRP